MRGIGCALALLLVCASAETVFASSADPAYAIEGRLALEKAGYGVPS
jgi:hypothetical protein